VWSSKKSSLATAIANSKVTLSLLEVVEELRELTGLERKFKGLLVEHISKNLNKQRVYWKQRGNIKWAQLGDQGSKIFHATATIRKRKSLITTLQSTEGTTFSDHRTKADILWTAFKERLGKSEMEAMLFNLQELLPVHDLESLKTPFTVEEIEGVIKDPPKDHQGKMGSIQTSLKDARISSQKTLLHFVKISIITK